MNVEEHPSFWAIKDMTIPQLQLEVVKVYDENADLAEELRQLRAQLVGALAKLDKQNERTGKSVPAMTKRVQKLNIEQQRRILWLERELETKNAPC